MAEKQDDEKDRTFLNRDALEGLEMVPTYLKIGQMLLLRYEEFLDLVAKFNRTLKAFTDDEAEFIEFSIQPETDTTMLWKLFVRIKCSRISRADQRVSDSMVLSLNQFLSVYQSLTQQMSIIEENPRNNLHNSAAATTTQQFNRSLSIGRLLLPTFDSDECCVCMERQSNLVLPCTHKICDECFKRWSAETSATGGSTCPICRVDVNTDSDFLVVEAPQSDALKRAIKESLLEFTKDGKKFE